MQEKDIERSAHNFRFYLAVNPSCIEEAPIEPASCINCKRPGAHYQPNNTCKPEELQELIRSPQKINQRIQYRAGQFTPYPAYSRCNHKSCMLAGAMVSCPKAA